MDSSQLKKTVLLIIVLTSFESSIVDVELIINKFKFKEQSK